MSLATLQQHSTTCHTYAGQQYCSCCKLAFDINYTVTSVAMTANAHLMTSLQRLNRSTVRTHPDPKEQPEGEVSDTNQIKV